MEHAYLGGIDAALDAFGMDKVAVLTPEQKAQMLAAYRARPKGMAAIPGAAGVPAAAPAAAPSGLELNRTPFTGGYGTQGQMPGGTVFGARGQVVGLPNKLAELRR